jgi:hypothetical protein
MGLRLEDILQNEVKYAMFTNMNLRLMYFSWEDEAFDHTATVDMDTHEVISYSKYIET